MFTEVNLSQVMLLVGAISSATHLIVLFALIVVTIFSPYILSRLLGGYKHLRLVQWATIVVLLVFMALSY